MGLLLVGLALVAVPDARPTPILRASWITDADYPVLALRNLQSGTVGYRLSVDAAGAVTVCSVTRPSGVPLLDHATCDVLKVRAKFVAPRDAAGHALASTYSGSVRWALPVMPAPPILPGIGVMPVVPISLGIGTMSHPNRFTRPSYLSPPPLPAKYRYPAPPPAAVPPPPPVDVAEDASPPADRAVRYGHLANGMRYAIMRNALSFDATSMRLSIAAGSLEETDAQRGYAHLVEHMMFRGSAEVPDGQFAKSLERVGLTLGTDTTAFTTPEAVLFGLDFPAATATPVTTGLFLLRQALDRATIAQAALDSERGVVLAERRLRDDPGQRWEVAREAFLLAGQRVPTRVTIGTLDAIMHADAAGLRAFYVTHFRPEKTLLVVVGNFNPDQVEHDIGVAFGTWADKTPAPPSIGQGRVTPRIQTQLYVEPDAPYSAEADWVVDYDDSADTLARERRQLANSYAASILTARLSRLADDVATPFVSAWAHRGALYHSATVTTLGTVPKPGQMDAAIVAALVEQRRLVTYGISQVELDRAIAQTRSGVARWTVGAATRGSVELASAIMHASDNHTVFVSPAQGAADMEKILSGITVADVDAGARRIFAGSGPLIFASAGKAPAGDEAGLAAAVAQAQARTIAPLPAAQKTVWPYAHFGAPGQIVSRKDIADLGVVIVQFANGTSVTVKSTAQPKDQILVNVNFGRGMAGLPDGLERSFWLVGGGYQTFLAGGLRKIDMSDLNEEFPGRRIGLSLGLTENRFVLAGETSGADLDLELQLMAAYVSDPGYQPAAFERARSLARTNLAQDHASASLAMDHDLFAMLSNGDRRWSLAPTAADIEASRSDDLARILGPALAGPLNLVVVGDVDVARAIAAAQATIGALPKRGPRPAGHIETFPQVPDAPIVVTDTGNADDAVVVAAWPVPGFFASMRDARGAQILADVVRGRLIDGLREKVGATYSPSVLIDQSEQSPEYGYMAANVELPPGQAGLFFATVGSIAADLIRTPISVKELGRARQPVLDSSRQKMHVISYWAYGLVGADEDPRMLDVMRTRLSDLAAVTPEDIQRLARKIFAGKTPYRVIFKAAGS